jgi:hypothetical protein
MRTLQTLADRLVSRFVPSVDAFAGCTPACYGPGSPACPSFCGRGCNVNADCSIDCFL